jgi:hypothetical protein
MSGTAQRCLVVYGNGRSSSFGASGDRVVYPSFLDEPLVLLETANSDADGLQASDDDIYTDRDRQSSTRVGDHREIPGVVRFFFPSFSLSTPSTL